MKVSKIILENENRIKVDFSYNREIVEKLKKLPNAKWSNSFKAWHIPFTKAALDQLKTIFPDVETPTSNSPAIPTYSTKNIHEKAEKIIHPQNTALKTGIYIIVFGRQMALKLPKNKVDIHFITAIRFSRWDAKQFCWIVPNYPGNLALLKDYFKERIISIETHETFDTHVSLTKKRKINQNDILVIRTPAERLKVIFAFNKIITAALKKMPFNSWNAQNKWWSIPYSEKFVNEIKSLAEVQNLTFLYEEEKATTSGKARISAFDISNYRTCPQA
jgi:integrase/recombinase XerD